MTAMNAMNEMSDRFNDKHEALYRKAGVYVNILASWTHRINVEKGFWEEDRNLGEALMLIVTEVAEAMEDVRAENFKMGPSTRTVNGKPIGFASELADIVIRVMDLAFAYDIDLGEEIVEKLKYNQGRPYKHGKRM